MREAWIWNASPEVVIIQVHACVDGWPNSPWGRKSPGGISKVNNALSEIQRDICEMRQGSSQCKKMIGITTDELSLERGGRQARAI